MVTQGRFSPTFGKSSELTSQLLRPAIKQPVHQPLLDLLCLLDDGFGGLDGIVNGGQDFGDLLLLLEWGQAYLKPVECLSVDSLMAIRT